MPKDSPYERDLARNAANYASLTPVSFIARTAYIWPQRTSVIHGERRYTWSETYARARRLASALVAAGEPSFEWQPPADEWDAISLNYTSGTTGNPKGVVYHHRGAYLNSLSNIVDWGMPRHSVYLWTLPMFHCNGWCFPWTVAANAGTNVCLRKVEARAILDAIRAYRVTHYCGAPIVHAMLINAPDEWKRGIDHRVHCLVAAAAPPASVIEGMERIGFDITHVYGLTETYGPAAICAKQPEWDG